MEELRVLEDSVLEKLKSLIHYNWLDTSSVLYKLMDVKSGLVQDVKADPEYYKRCIKDDNINTSLMLQLFEKRFVNKPKIEDVEASELSRETLEFLDGLQFYYDGLHLNAAFKKGYQGDVFIRRPRGVAFELKEMEFSAGNLIGVTGFYDIYSHETFVFSCTTREGRISVVPEETSGIKGTCSINVYELRDRVIKRADVSSLEQLGDILKLVRG